MTIDELELEIKNLIIETLELEDIKSQDIDSNAPLFVEGLGLDSIDALEIGLALKKKYKINFQSQAEENKKHFSSVHDLAKFVMEASQS